MDMVNVIAGLAWDPEIRGFMAVLTGVVVLMGSVWLVISTNTGVRLGTLIAGAGFFGWMTIMATTWWIYGIGYAGDRPVFEQVEIVEGDVGGSALRFAELDKAKELDSEDLPNAHELLVAAHDAAVAEYGEGVFGDGDWQPDGLSASELADLAELRLAWTDFGAVTVDTLPEGESAGKTDEELQILAEEQTARNQAITLSELDAVAPSLIPTDLDELGPWRLLSTADMGEAQASAIAFLLDSPDFDFGSQTEFRILNGFTTGGKRGLPDDPNRWDRISTQIRTALTLKHPTGYAIVQVQAVTAESIDNLPGTAPKRPIVDETQPVVSVVMIRNLGNLRQLPAFVALGSLLIFLSLAYVLHERDKVVMARRAEFAGVA
jgi:hypothetical protein